MGMRICGDEPVIEKDSPVACYELYVNTIRHVESNAYIIILSYCLFDFLIETKEIFKFKVNEGRKE